MIDATTLLLTELLPKLSTELLSKLRTEPQHFFLLQKKLFNKIRSNLLIVICNNSY